MLSRMSCQPVQLNKFIAWANLAMKPTVNVHLSAAVKPRVSVHLSTDYALMHMKLCLHFDGV